MGDASRGRLEVRWPSPSSPAPLPLPPLPGPLGLAGHSEPAPQGCPRLEGPGCGWNPADGVEGSPWLLPGLPHGSALSWQWAGLRPQATTLPWELLAHSALPAGAELGEVAPVVQAASQGPGLQQNRVIFFIKKQNLNQENKVIKFLLRTEGPAGQGVTVSRGARGPSAVAQGKNTNRKQLVFPNVWEGWGPQYQGPQDTAASVVALELGCSILKEPNMLPPPWLPPGQVRLGCVQEDGPSTYTTAVGSSCSEGAAIESQAPCEGRRGVLPGRTWADLPSEEAAARGPGPAGEACVKAPAASPSCPQPHC